MRWRLLISAGVLAAAAIGIFFFAFPKRPEPPAPRGQRKMIAPSASKQCPEGNRTRLIVMFGDDVVQQLTVEEAVMRMGGAKIAHGRHEGERALPLVTILKEREAAREVEVIPCTGDPVRFSARDLMLDRERLMLVRSKRGSLKLIDRDSDKGSALVKNVALVRLMP